MILRLIPILALVVLDAHAQLDETFEKSVVGQRPAYWEPINDKKIPAQVVVTNHVPGLAREVRALKLVFEEAQGEWGLRREFDPLDLAPENVIEWGFKFNVARLPESKRDSPGFCFTLHNSRTSAQLASPRFLTQSEGMQWILFNPNYSVSGGGSYITKDLDVGGWHDLRFVIAFDEGSTTKGTVKWHLDRKLVNTETFTNVVENAAFFEALTIQPVVTQDAPGAGVMYIRDLSVARKPRGSAK